MAFQSTTGVGVAAQINCNGNSLLNPRQLNLSVTNTTFPSTFQLNPMILDALGNPQSLGTTFTLTAVAASTPVAYTLTAVSATSSTPGGVVYATYTGTVTGGGSNAYAGRQFVVTGFALNSGVNNGTFQCTASTATTLNLTNSNAVAETHAGAAQDQTATAVYTGTITGGGSNAFADADFVVAGFTNASNNGTYFCSGSSTTTLTLDNPSGIAETHAGTAQNEESAAQGMTYWSNNATYATVSATGLVTAVKAGDAVIEISYPAFNNTYGLIGSSGNVMNGTPSIKIWREMNVRVRV